VNFRILTFHCLDIVVDCVRGTASVGTVENRGKK